ncbi:MAG: DUF6889 family protein [Acidobacteriota bacterium]
MPSGEDWLLRPVIEGMCRYESLLDGTVDLGDIARMNDALDVKQENERRITAALAKLRENGGVK